MIGSKFFYRNFWWLPAMLAFYQMAAQAYWQQEVKYRMDVDMDVRNHRYHGHQLLAYTNHSPDTLTEVYYHLYWNAFQKGSAMYWHNHTRKDPDPRIERLADIKPGEEGRYFIHSLKQDGQPVGFDITETVMRVKLAHPLAPGQTTELEMDYDVQIPVLIRRSGRDNAEGIAYSMAQWYPKLAEYRPDGWHADPYLGREFFGVWGDFDVTIHIDRNYTVAATGYLQNPDEVKEADFPTDDLRKKRRKRLRIKYFKQKKLTWHFVAPKVHDFSWAADPFYEHRVVEGPRGVELHFYYVPENKKIRQNWDSLMVYMPRAMAYYDRLVGPYPYRKYSFIQAGDGGMEYAMCTFISGKRKLGGLVGTSMHELAHSWFQFVIATDETRHPWMDEGFTTFVSHLAIHDLWYLPHGESKGIVEDNMSSYMQYVALGQEEPVSLFSDFYDSHLSYWVNAYDKGALFLAGYIQTAGMKALFRFLQNYYRDWQFKHPEPEDMLREAEKAAGMELDWYYNHWIDGIKHIDYAIDTVQVAGKDSTLIRLVKKGNMPMPLDVLVYTRSGKTYIWHVPYFRTLHYRREPLLIRPDGFETVKPWFDGFPDYALKIPVAYEDIKLILLNPDNMVPDIRYEDNVWTKDDEK